MLEPGYATRGGTLGAAKNPQPERQSVGQLLNETDAALEALAGTIGAVDRAFDAVLRDPAPAGESLPTPPPSANVCARLERIIQMVIAMKRYGDSILERCAL